MANRPYYDVGLHVGLIVSQQLTEAKTGTAQFVMRVKIMGAPTGDGGYDPYTNQYERTIYMALTEKTIDFVAPQLQKLGFTGTSLGQLDPNSPNHQSFVNNYADLWCSHKDDQQGNPRESWGISQDQPEREPLDPKKLRQLDSLFGKALRATGKPAPVTVQRPSRVDDINEITDDDIPF